MSHEKHTSIGLVAILMFGWGATGLLARVPKRIENQIKTDIVPAFQRDDWRGFEKVLCTWVDKFDGEELDEIDSMLDTHGAPSIGHLLLDARMAELLAGRSSTADQPRELTRSMPVLRTRIDELVREVKDARHFQDPLPEFGEIKEYQGAFWDIHVASNKLRSAEKLARYGQQVTGQLLEKKIRDLSDSERDNLNIDFAQQAKVVRQTLDELDEIKIEMQVTALSKAAKIVRESQDYQERLRAGFILAFSADPVLEILREAKPEEFDRPRLKDARLLTSVESNVRYARESSGDVIEQARLLYLGMHWWMRGRYGQGPDGMGLLKSVAALRSTAAQFPLYMPTKPPKPTDLSEAAYGAAVPKYDRRHHYIWMYEYRTIQQHVDNQWRRDSSKKETVTSKTRLDRFY